MGDIRDNPKGFIHRMVLPTRHMLLVWYLASTWRQANWSKGKRLPIWLNPTAKLVSHVLPIYQKQLDLSNTEYPKMAMKQWGNRGKHDQLIMMIPPQVVTGPHIHQSHPHLSRDHTEVFSHFRNWTTMSRKFSTSNGWFDPSLTRAWKWIQGAKPSHVHQGSYETRILSHSQLCFLRFGSSVPNNKIIKAASHAQTVQCFWMQSFKQQPLRTTSSKWTSICKKKHHF